jgi:arginase
MAAFRPRRPRGTFPEVGLLGVPSNSAGRGDGTAAAPGALRAAGLAEALRRAGGVVHDYGDVALPEPSPDRDRTSGLIDPSRLAAVVVAVREAVDGILSERRFPLVVGGDCPLVLGCLAAARDRAARTGLLFVDGHEDAYLPEQSRSGEAADTEMAFALGIARAEWSTQLSSILPVIEADDVEVLGPRDRPLLDAEGVPSIEGRVHSFADASRVAEDPGALAAAATEYLSRRPGGFWLHVDLDVLSTDALSAVDYPQDGGIGWEALASIAATALAEPAAVGWDVTVYNPDLDPERTGAERIVRLIAGAVECARSA